MCGGLHPWSSIDHLFTGMLGGMLSETGIVQARGGGYGGGGWLVLGPWGPASMCQQPMCTCGVVKNGLALFDP